MNQDNLKTHLQRHYQRQQPPEDLVKNVQALLAASRAPRSPPPRRWAPPLGLAAAALFAVVSAVQQPWLRVNPQQVASQQLQTIARRVVAHHSRCRVKLGDEAASLEVARRELLNLGFELVEPAVIARRGLTVVGARRCLLEGEVAAEVRVKYCSGRLGTLMVTRVPEGLTPPPAQHLVMNGVDVELWTEGGLLVWLAVPV